MTCNRIAASTCDGTAAVQVHSQDEITQPVEQVSSVEAKDVASKETTTPSDSKITAYSSDDNADCKYLVIPFAPLSACKFHRDTCIKVLLFLSYS